MKLNPVDSSSIQEIGHDAVTNKLRVRFKPSSQLWEYDGVTADAYRKMMAATSLGAHFQAMKSRWTGRKVEEKK